MNIKSKFSFIILGIFIIILSSNFVNAIQSDIDTSQGDFVDFDKKHSSDFGWIYGFVYSMNSENDNKQRYFIDEVEICAYKSDDNILESCTKTDIYGSFSMSLAEGSYNIVAYKEGYEIFKKNNIEISKGAGYNYDIFLSSIDSSVYGEISLRVFEILDKENVTYTIPIDKYKLTVSHLENNVITLSKYFNIILVDKDKCFNISTPVGYNKIIVNKTGFYPVTKFIQIDDKELSELNIYLKKIEIQQMNSISGRVFEKIVKDNLTYIEPLAGTSVSLSYIGTNIRFDFSNDNIFYNHSAQKNENKEIVNKKSLTIEKKIDNSTLIITNIAEIDNIDLISYEKIDISTKSNTNVYNDYLENINDNYLKTYRVIITDENGAFSFKDLPSGTYGLWVSKSGYLSENMEFGLQDYSIKVDFILEKNEIESIEDYQILPLNESIIHYREIGGLNTVKSINKAIESGDVGGEVIIYDSLDSQVIHYSDMFIKNLDIFKNNKKSELILTVSGNHSSSGKTIVLNIDDGFFDKKQSINIKYDGYDIKMAEDLEDILDPGDDGSLPEYLIITGSSGSQILVSIPHFSEHVISISGFSEVIDYFTGIVGVLTYIAMCIIAAVIFIGLIYLRKRY